MIVLLTSVGRRVELVRAFQAAFGRLGIDGRIVGTDIDPLAPAMQIVDASIIVPRCTEPNYVETIRNVCFEHNVSVVFPLIDTEISLLANSKSIIEVSGARMAVVDPIGAEIGDDKWRAYEFFRQIGVQTPRSWLPESMPAEAMKFPLFIKPRNGSASENTFKVSNAAELEFFSAYVPNPIIQEYLPGPEITSDIVCDLDSNVISVVSRKRIAVRGGEAVKAVTVRDQRIYDACNRIATSLPAIGPITAQCMLSDGVPHFIEINARLGGGIPLAIAAGVDVPAILISTLLGFPLDELVAAPYTVGLNMTRFDNSIFLRDEDLIAGTSQ